MSHYVDEYIEPEVEDEASLTPKQKREKALKDLLAPVDFTDCSNNTRRMYAVRNHHYRVHLVMPFLTWGEQQLAEAWLKREAHDKLMK